MTKFGLTFHNIIALIRYITKKPPVHLYTVFIFSDFFMVKD